MVLDPSPPPLPAIYQMDLTGNLSNTPILIRSKVTFTLPKETYIHLKSTIFNQNGITVYQTRRVLALFYETYTQPQETYSPPKKTCILSKTKNDLQSIKHALNRVAKNHRMPYLWRSFSEKEPHN